MKNESPQSHIHTNTHAYTVIEIGNGIIWELSRKEMLYTYIHSFIHADNTLTYGPTNESAAQIHIHPLTNTAESNYVEASE